MQLLGYLLLYHNPHQRLCCLSSYAENSRWILPCVPVANKEMKTFLCREHVRSFCHQLNQTHSSFLPSSIFLFRRFSCVSYRNGLKRGTSKLWFSKHMNPVGSIFFGCNSHFSVFVNKVRSLKTLLDCILNRSSFSRVHLIIKTKDTCL